LILCGDSSKLADGDLAQALNRIQAKTYVIAFERDMFVPVEDCRYEQQFIADSELKVIPSLMGHFAMLGLLEEDFSAVNGVLAELLEA